MPNPTEGGYSVYNRDGDSENTTRDELWLLHRERIRTGMKAIDIKWKVQGADYQTVINALAPAQIVVTFFDPNDATYYTQEDMYAGDKTASLVSYLDENTPENAIWELSTTLTCY